jgi:hypothetical protein
VSSLVELTILEKYGLQEDLGGFIMETITLSNQGFILDVCLCSENNIFDVDIS